MLLGMVLYSDHVRDYAYNVIGWTYTPMLYSAINALFFCRTCGCICMFSQKKIDDTWEWIWGIFLLGWVNLHNKNECYTW